jgi:hypothetical protein
VVDDPDSVFAYPWVEPISSTSSVVTLHLLVADNAAVGRYTRPMTLHVCHDAACGSEVKGFPRTIRKDVTIQGVTANVSALSFTSSAGIAPPVQTLAVTAPAGADFEYVPYLSSPYVTYTDPNGSTTLLNTSSIFEITKTATGFQVQALGVWPGHYVGDFYITTSGFQTVDNGLDYQVGAGSTPVVTPLTTSISATGRAGSFQDIPVYIDFVMNMSTIDGSSGGSSLNVVPTGGTVDPGPTYWLRYYDSSYFTSGAGPEDNAQHLLFYLNPCFFAPQCLPAGRYTADVVYTGAAFGSSTTFTVPVTFDITP